MVINERAYHGTTHKIDTFTTKVIGKVGRGNNMHGWGLYFSPSYEDAEFYSGANKKAYVGAEALNPPTPHIYEVELNADPKSFLDWEKVINLQPSSIRTRIGLLLDDDMKTEIGGMVYARISNKLGSDEKASKHLFSLGIPGIRYPHSTAVAYRRNDIFYKDEEYSYVVFDDSLITNLGDKLHERVALTMALPYELVRSTKYGDLYQFDVGDEAYLIALNLDGNELEIQFSPEAKRSQLSRYDAVPRASLTQAGQIFATAAKAALEFLSEHPEVTAIGFSAEKTDRSRLALYQRFARDIAEFFGGTVRVFDDPTASEYSNIYVDLPKKLQERINLEMATPFELIDDEHYQFTSDGELFEVLCEPGEDGHGVTFAFYPKEKLGKKSPYGGWLDIYTLTPRSSLAKVGEIFATVAQVMKDFLDNHSWITEAWIAADKSDKSRAPLYSRLMKEFAGHLNGEFIAEDLGWANFYGVKIPKRVQEAYAPNIPPEGKTKKIYWMKAKGLVKDFLNACMAHEQLSFGFSAGPGTLITLTWDAHDLVTYKVTKPTDPKKRILASGEIDVSYLLNGLLQEKYEQRDTGKDFLDFMLSPNVIAKLTAAEEPYEIFEDLCMRHGVMLERAWTNDAYVYGEQGIQGAQAFDNNELELQVDIERITEILDWLKDDGPLRDTEYNQLIKMMSVLVSHEKVHHAQFDAAGPLYTVRRKDLEMEQGNFQYLSNEREIHAHAAAAVDEWLVKGYIATDILSWLGDTKKIKDHAGESNDFWKYWDYFGSAGSDDPRDVKVWKEFLTRVHDFAQQAAAKQKVFKETLDSSLDDVKVYPSGSRDPDTLFYKVIIGQTQIKAEFSLFQGTLYIGFMDLNVDATEDLMAPYALKDRGGDLKVMFKIFTFFAQRIPEVLEHFGKRVKRITFTAKHESSRVSLYRRLAKKMSDALNWRVMENEDGNETLFTVFRPTRTRESISPNYFKNGGPTRKQNNHDSFESMGPGGSQVFLHGFDLEEVYDKVHNGTNWPRAGNTSKAPEIRGK
jgi:hypothetical protein